MLIIIPGWKQGADAWDLVSQALSTANIDHHILDIPGFGRIPIDPTLKNFDDLTNWCQKEIVKISTGKPYALLGHSCGGRVALELATRNPEQIEQLVLTGSPNLYRPSLAVQLVKLLAKIFRPVRSFVPQKVRSRLRSDDYEAVRGSDMQSLYNSVYQHDQGHLFANLQIPVQLLWGERDQAAPLRIAKEIQSIYPKATLEVIKTVGHNIHLEKPNLLAAKIINVLHDQTI